MKNKITITLPEELIELNEQDKIEPNIVIEGLGFNGIGINGPRLER